MEGGKDTGAVYRPERREGYWSSIQTRREERVLELHTDVKGGKDTRVRNRHEGREGY